MSRKSKAKNKDVKSLSMKVTFLFGGALTAIQSDAVQGEIDKGNTVDVVKSMDMTFDYDLLVYGDGFSVASDKPNSIKFSDYVDGLSVGETALEVLSEVTHVDDCCDLDADEK